MLAALLALPSLIGALIEAIIAVLAVWSIITLIFDPNGKTKVANLIGNIIGGSLSIAATLLGDLEGQLSPIATAFVTSVQANGGAIAKEVTAPIAALATGAFNDAAGGLIAVGESTPDNAVSTAGDALGNAFGFGMSSAAVAAMFESVFPEKLNVLDGVAPMLSKMAGFDEIAAAVRDPLYNAAFGKSLEYHYRSIFKPELPREQDAVLWHARRLLTDDQLKTIFNYSGLKTEYETAFVTSAYRSLQPRIFATLLQDLPFPTAQVQSALQFYGLRDADVSFMLDALELNSTRNVRQQYLAAAVRSTELGTMTPQELTDSMNQLGFSQDAQTWVQLTVATRKLEQLAELYRKSISEAYKYGQVSDANYVPSLEAIGIGAADAQAHYAIDSITKQGRIAAAALKAEERLAQQQLRASVKTSIAQYRSGAIDGVALEAELVAAGLDPIVASFTTELEALKLNGNEVYVYGRELPRAAALVLREQVSALATQTRAGLVSPADALTSLAALSIPAANAQALVAQWAATKTPAADVGVLEPR